MSYSKQRSKYNFDDFTLKNYRELLRLAKMNFSFQRIDKIDEKPSVRTVFWRHDVDFSVHRAVKLARVERNENVRSIFFFRLHSEFYNLFEKEVFESVKMIINLNHEIGLHFDYNFYKIKTEKQLETLLSFERSIIEKIFDVKIGAFSFHNPTEDTFKFDKHHYTGLVNTYSRYFRKTFDYCSDSNGYWRFRRLLDVLNDNSIKRLHVLTHPEWWQDIVLSPRKRIQRSINGRAKKQKHVYNKALKDYGRKNI